MTPTTKSPSDPALPSGYEGLVERLKQVASRRHTISHDAYGAKKALGIMNEMSAALDEALAALGRVQPTMDSTKALNPKALEAAIRAYDETILNNELGDAKHVVRAYLTALAAQGEAVQPVAWRYQFRTGDAWTLTNHKPSDRAIPATGKIEPLFATPPAPQPALALADWSAIVDKLIEDGLPEYFMADDRGLDRDEYAEWFAKAHALASAKHFKGE